MPLRFDASTFTYKQDSNGFLLVEARPTRVGVLTYSDQNGNTWNELRHPEDVFASESMESLKLLPVTIEHPGKLLDTSDAEIHSCGTVGENIRRDGNFIACKLMVRNKTAVDKVLSKKLKELSAGYKCDIIDEQGTYEGTPYQKRQKNILYNHVALTQSGRAGADCQIRLDSESAVSFPETLPDMEVTVNFIERILAKIESGALRLDSETIRVPEEAKNAIEILVKRESQLLEHIQGQQKEMDRLQGRFDSADRELQQANAQLKNAIPEDRLDSIVEELITVRNMAKDVGVETKGKNANVLKKEILHKTGTAQEKLDSASDEYLNGAFERVQADWEHRNNVSKSNDLLSQIQPVHRVSQDDLHKQINAIS